MSNKKIINLLNKGRDEPIAYNLKEEDPTKIPFWIPTGSRWLDLIISKSKEGGIPAGKIVEVAGLPATGKSYLAYQIIKNAQEMGLQAVLFDIENAVNSSYLEKIGIDTSELILVPGGFIEDVFGSIEKVLKAVDEPVVFVWDSLGSTESTAENEKSLDPTKSMALKPRAISKGLSRVSPLLARKKSTLIIVNQLYTNLGNTYDPYKAKGGEAVNYMCSLRVWLTSSNTESTGKGVFGQKFSQDNKNLIGSSVRVKVKKSRFGTLGRTCEFKILWGDNDDVIILDEESWLEAIKPSPRVKTGQWWIITYKDGTEKKFRSKQWMEELQDSTFRKEVEDIMEEVWVHGVVGEKDNKEVDDD